MKGGEVCFFQGARAKEVDMLLSSDSPGTRGTLWYLRVAETMAPARFMPGNSEVLPFASAKRVRGAFRSKRKEYHEPSMVEAGAAKQACQPPLKIP